MLNVLSLNLKFLSYLLLYIVNIKPSKLFIELKLMSNSRKLGHPFNYFIYTNEQYEAFIYSNKGLYPNDN